MIVRLTLLLVCLSLTSSLALAGDPTVDYQRAMDPVTFHGGSSTAAKATGDSILLMGPTGSGAPYTGDFEFAAKVLDPTDVRAHGWTSVDLTQREGSYWHVSDYFAVNGSYSAFCGDETIPSCDGAIDPVGGYGDNWNELLEYRGTVTDNSVATTVTITATANIFSEPGYDGTTLQVEKFDMGFIDLAYWDGVSSGLAISEAATYQPGDYMGPGADEIVVIWRFESDGGWSDEDCSFPSAGGIQLDDFSITSDNGAGTGGVVDFEDQTLGVLAIRLPQGVGDFARIWNSLESIDPCLTNSTNQVAFIDDGIVVPGTGGTPCQDWCYGPGGYIVNTTGGLAGPSSFLHNLIYSPVMDWPDAGQAGGRFDFGVNCHEDLSSDAPGMFYVWCVRSTNTGDPVDIEAAPWLSRNFVHYGQSYKRHHEWVSDLVEPGATHVQLYLGVYELGWVWGWNGNDGYPAPYFDNVRFTTFDVVGPALQAREIDLAQDNFPAAGTIDMADPAALSVRFDGSQDISPPSHQNPAAADSMAFDCSPNGLDGVLEGLPQLVYRVKTNPVFDPYRTDPLPMTGQVDCPPAVRQSGIVVPDRSFGDLPDENWLFPGDVVHYFIQATERDTLTDALETALLPADTTGFSDFDDALNYPSSWTVRCLPTIRDLAGTQPPFLFWNDFADRGGQQEWYGAFDNLGLVRGVHFDEYYTNGPSSGVGNGLGGRATSLQLDGYGTMAYTAGNLSVNTISNGDVRSDSGPDAELLLAWLDQGDKHLFATGDNLASDLASAGLDTDNLLTNYFNVTVNDRDIRDLIAGQVTPVVLPTPSETVFNTVGSWVAYGGCGVINTFDAVTAGAGGTRIAVWTDPSGVDGGYPYSACTIASGVGVTATSEVISMPYDFMYIYTDPDEVIPAKIAAKTAARVRVLNDVLARFSLAGDPTQISGANAPKLVMSAMNVPNPFNPLTEISFVAPRNGLLTVKIYNVRGGLVRTLLNENVTAGPDVVEWNGKDHRGSQVASGVYFYEVRQGGQQVLGKMALVR